MLPQETYFTNLAKQFSKLCDTVETTETNASPIEGY